MFTPMNIQLGPRHGNEVGHIRTTIGKYRDGEEFSMVDVWKTNPMPHKALSSPWCGVTMFTDKLVPKEVIDEALSSLKIGAAQRC